MTVSDFFYYLSDAPIPPGGTPRVRLAPGASGPVGAPIRATLSSEDAPTGMTAKVFRPPDYRHAELVLTGSKMRGGQVRLNEPGDGHMTIPNRHTDRNLVECDDLIVYEWEGEPFWSWLVGPSSSASIRQTQAGQVTTFSGPGVLGLMAKAPVLPSNGLDAQPVEEDRLYSWPSPQYVDTSWRPSTQITTVADSVGVWPLTFGGIDEHAFPDTSAPILGPHDGTQTSAPVGFCYYRGEVEIATTGKYNIYVAADNVVVFYVDGQKLIRGDDVRLTSFITLDLSAGTHTFAALVFSGPQPLPAAPTENNPLGLAVAWYSADQAGNALVLIGHADTSWRILEYPPVAPGMTVGEALTLAVSEAQALGMLTGWTCAFDREVDSNGVPWGIAPDLATKVGYSIETFIAELTSTYIDIRASIGGLILYAYVKDTLGSVRTLSMHPPTDPDDPTSGNLQELTHDRQPRVANFLLVRHQGGWHAVSDVSPGDVTTCATLGLGSAQSITEVERIAGGQLVRYAHQRDAITAKFLPRNGTELPHRAGWVGDTIDVDDRDGVPAAQRILAWTFDEDPQGVMSWAPEIADVVKTADERALQAIAKMANGTIAGDSIPAQPVSSISTPGPSCCPPPVTIEA